MTERESEQFYHDLRQKLEGYGSAPPESVWAGIREQVPAQPKRRWRPLLLLLFLVATLAGITIGTRAWRQPDSKTETASGALASAVSPSGTTSQGATTLSDAENLTLPEETAAQEAQPAESLTASANSAATENLRASAAAVSTPLRSTKALGSARLTAAAQPEERSRAEKATVSAADAASRGSRSRRKALLTTTALASPYTSEAKAGHKAPFTRRKAATTSVGSLSEVNRLAASTPTPRSLAGRRGTRVADILTSGKDAEAFRDSEQAKATRQKTTKRTFSNEPLRLLVVKAPALPQEEPEVRAKRRPRTKPTRRELRLRGWSTQLLLGSGLTYRALGGSPTQLEQLEQPGIGFSGQVSGAYAVTRQLTVSAGLGYAEYATNLNYQLTKSSADNAQTIAFRDVYRFLTVPVQGQLTLQGNHRWRYGVQGGGTLAFLTGARTTQGSACNCSQRQWQPGSGYPTPYQATNLLLNVGAFANYQFAPGQWLTVRPQAEIFLNSLTTQASGRAPRRPWSLGIQAGYSWDLDPRKH